jgi:hypothetical protein
VTSSLLERRRAAGRKFTTGGIGSFVLGGDELRLDVDGIGVIEHRIS